MNASKAIKFPRTSYWVGAIFDPLVIIPLLVPKVAGVAFGIPNFNPGNDYRYVTYITASLMLGWAFLLIWADREPVERRGILPLTIFPVLTGLILAGVYAVTQPSSRQIKYFQSGLCRKFWCFYLASAT